MAEATKKNQSPAILSYYFNVTQKERETERKKEREKDEKKRVRIIKRERFGVFSKTNRFLNVVYAIIVKIYLFDFS